MVDLQQIRRTIEASPKGPVAIVTREWLEQVELELRTGAAALAEVASIRAERGAIS